MIIITYWASLQNQHDIGNYGHKDQLKNKTKTKQTNKQTNKQTKTKTKKQLYLL